MTGVLSGLFRSGRVRPVFSLPGHGTDPQSPPLRRLVWLGALPPEIARELATVKWTVVPLPVDAAMEASVGRAEVEVAIVDLADGEAAWLARVETLIAAHHELQWLAVVSERALMLPRVCELIHDLCFDFFIPPLHNSRLAITLGRAWGKAQLLKLARDGDVQPDAIADLGLVGASAALQTVRDALCKFAEFDMPVLVTGETGTGKEVAARAVHDRSARRSGPFIAVNCGALPANLVQSELFGHERGAFTGANVRKIGRIEAADGGTIFLDEIGDMPVEAQSNLLRFLEERTIDRVGGTRSIRVDARVVAATHVDLPRAVREGRFREDLYYRLNVLHVHLPALRERSGDAQILARHFLDGFRRRHTTRARKFSAAALKAIDEYAWPGNIRELINRVQRAAVTADRRLLDPQHLGIGPRRVTAQSLRAARGQADRETIAETLRDSGYNMSECARRLNISRNSLYRLCKKHGIKINTAALPLAATDLPLEQFAAASAWLATCCDWLRQALLLA